MKKQKLFMVLLGASVTGRLIEQHDVFFAVANDLQQLIPSFEKAWPQAEVHIDAWRAVTLVDGHHISIGYEPSSTDLKLYFFNLGGYVPGDMEEHHHKALVVAKNQKEAIEKIKQSEFYQNRGYEGAQSHIDDKMSVDIDDVHVVNDLIAGGDIYLHISANAVDEADDAWQVGYLSLSKLAKQAPSIEA